MADVKEINRYFRTAIQEDFDRIEQYAALTDVQYQIFRMRYAQGKSIGFIADTLGYSQQTVKRYLKQIRDKINRII